jgi:hypothetical protein
LTGGGIGRTLSWMRLTIAALAMLAAACGTDPMGGDDAEPTVDSALAQPVTIDVMPLCQTYTWEAKVGQVVRERNVIRVATVDGVTPETTFALERCGAAVADFQVTTPACPAGMTCTGTGGPAGPACQRLMLGSFVAGKLTVFCGGIYQRFDATGAESSRGEIGYDSLRVTVY